MALTEKDQNYPNTLSANDLEFFKMARQTPRSQASSS